MIIFVFLQVKRGDVEHHLQTDMSLHLDLSCVKLNKTEDQLRNTQEELHHTQEKLEKFEKITRKLEDKVIALENRLMQCSEEHTWKISGISEVWRHTRTESAPFYTRKYGYKFKIRLFRSPGKHVDYGFSIFLDFILMKGEYDAILHWPFNEKVTCSVIDQQENENDRENIVGLIQVQSSWNQKPVSDENEPAMFSYRDRDCIYSQRLRRERRFIVDDTLFVQVKIDPPERV